MSAVMDLAPAPMVAAGGYAWPDDVATGTARQARIDLAWAEPMHAAEDFVAAVGYDWHLPNPVMDALKSATAELVDNAATWAVWPSDMHVIPVNVTLHPHRVVLEVRDPDPYLPPIPEPTAGLNALVAALNDPTVKPDEVELTSHGLAIVAGLCESLVALAEPIGKVMRVTVALPDNRAGSVIAPASDATRFGGAR